MTAHHQGAIDMARIAQKRAEHPRAPRARRRHRRRAGGEISTMNGIREEMHGAGEHGGGHMGMSESEMGMDMDPAELETAKPFDRAFIDAMVPHHQGAVAMAKQLLKNGEHPELQKMAQDIIDAQTDEIAQMREWRKNWYGSAGTGGHEAMHGEG
jgi:uncharacterized protein (DUF305 family)